MSVIRCRKHSEKEESGHEEHAEDAGSSVRNHLVAGLLLGCVYQITKEPIARQEALAQENACREVFSDAESLKL